MSEQPTKVPGLRLCLALTRDGLTAYGNREAFTALRQWMQFVEESPEGEHYECHVAMSLEDDESRFDGKTPRNVAVLFDRRLADLFPHRSDTSPGFELTFMKTTKDGLDEMERYQHDALLPLDWNENLDDAIETATVLGDDVAAFHVAVTYRVKGDARNARIWFERALRAGDGEAALELAKMYMISDLEHERVREYLTTAIDSDSICEASREEAKALLAELS